MATKKSPFLRRKLHSKLSDEQCCQLVAMADVLGEKAAENHFKVTIKVIRNISQKVKERPDLEEYYWDYRKSMAKGWIRQLGETTSAVLIRMSQEVTKDKIDALALRELTRAIEVLGDISVSAIVAGPPDSEDGEQMPKLPKYGAIDVESEDEDEDEDEDGEPFLLPGQTNAYQ
jgi:hypothetical protein